LRATARTVPAAGEVGNLDGLFTAGRAAGVTYLPGFAAAVDNWADPLVIQALTKHEKQPA
jgi:hypothetical protein